MKRIDIHHTIQVIANVGVIAGLLLLAYELRQNTYAIGGTTVQSIADQSLEAAFAGLENRELRVAWQRAALGAGCTTAEDWSILGWWYAGVMRIVENRYRQTNIGTANPELMRQVGGASAAYRHPFFEQWWALNRRNYAEDFRSWVDANLLPLVRDSLQIVPEGLMLPEVMDANACR